MTSFTDTDMQRIRTMIREETDDIRQDVTRTGVLLENLEHEFKALAEAVSDELKLIRQVREHDIRISHLEADNHLIKATVTTHSKQLKSLGAE